MGINVSVSSVVLSEVSYTQVQVLATVTMPDVLGVDILTTTDAITAKSFAKNRADTQAILDSAVRAITKARADTQAIADALSTKAFSKARAETVSVPDLMTRAINKAPFTDQPTATDATSLTPGKTLSDATDGWTDQITGKVFTKGLSDTISFTDHAEAYKVFTREYEDFLSLPDAIAKAYTPPDKTDSAAVFDASSVEVEKNVVEGINLIDNMDGNIEYVIVKLIGELLISSDSKAVDFTKNSTDNVTSSDAGLLSMQSYCDLSYFAEDYVGVARNF